MQVPRKKGAPDTEELSAQMAGVCVQGCDSGELGVILHSSEAQP